MEGLPNASDVARGTGHSRTVVCLMENDSCNLFGLQWTFRACALSYGNAVQDPAVSRCPRKQSLAIGSQMLLAFWFGKARPANCFTTLSRAPSIASRDGHTEMARFLIREGGDVNAVVKEVHPQRDERHSGLSPSRRAQPSKYCSPSSLTWLFLRIDLCHRPILGNCWRKADATAQEATIHLCLIAVQISMNWPIAQHILRTRLQLIVRRALFNRSSTKAAVLNESTSEGQSILQAAAGRSVGQLLFWLYSFKPGQLLQRAKLAGTGFSIQPSYSLGLGDQELVTVAVR